MVSHQRKAERSARMKDTEMPSCGCCRKGHRLLPSYESYSAAMPSKSKDHTRLPCSGRDKPGPSDGAVLRFQWIECRQEGRRDVCV